MSSNYKQVANGKGTDLTIGPSKYISVGKDGNDITLRCGDKAMSFSTMEDLINAIDPDKTAWFQDDSMYVDVSPDKIDVRSVTLIPNMVMSDIPNRLLLASSDWWLSDNAISIPGHEQAFYAYGGVTPPGVKTAVTSVTGKLGIRPVLVIGNMDDLGLAKGRYFNYRGYRWTVVSATMALCDRIIGTSTYTDAWVRLDEWASEKEIIKQIA